MKDVPSEWTSSTLVVPWSMLLTDRLVILPIPCDHSALSPVHPYPEHAHRLRLAAVLLPIALLTAFVKVQYMARAATFFMGVGFFSQPYITKGWRWFIKNYPNWMDFLQVQK